MIKGGGPANILMNVLETNRIRCTARRVSTHGLSLACGASGRISARADGTELRCTSRPIATPRAGDVRIPEVRVLQVAVSRTGNSCGARRPSPRRCSAFTPHLLSQPRPPVHEGPERATTPSRLDPMVQAAVVDRSHAPRAHRPLVPLHLFRHPAGDRPEPRHARRLSGGSGCRRKPNSSRALPETADSADTASRADRRLTTPAPHARTIAHRQSAGCGAAAVQLRVAEFLKNPLPGATGLSESQRAAASTPALPPWGGTSRVSSPRGQARRPSANATRSSADVSTGTTTDLARER